MEIGKNVKIKDKDVFKNKKVQNAIMGYAMISPQLIGFFVFTLYPMLWVMSKSFYYYTGVEQTMRWVGFENFLNLFKMDPAYWRAWLTTFEFAIIKLPIELPFAIIVAVLLNQKNIRFKGFFRGLYFMPHIISAAIIGLVFSNMFDYFGFINGILMKLGFISEGIEWFATKKGAMTVLIIGSFWSCFGINVLYCLAGLQNISDDLYEAAYLDGTSKVRCFWSITLPLMAPVLQIIMLLAVNGSLHMNDFVLVMTNGAPGGQTHFIQTYLARQFMPGFATSSTVNIGYGSAVYIITSIINSAIALVYMKLSNKLKNMY